MLSLGDLLLFSEIVGLLGSLLIYLLILFSFPSEEQIVQLLHHHGITLNRRVNLHRVIIDQLLKQDFLLLGQQTGELFEDLS